MTHVPFPGHETANNRLVAKRRHRPDGRYPPPAVHVGGAVLLGAAVVVLVLAIGSRSAHAAVPGSVLAAESIEAVANNIRNWLVGILMAVATLFLSVGGLRYMAANGDPGEVEKAKLAIRSALLGYSLALLAPLLVTIVGTWVA